MPAESRYPLHFQKSRKKGHFGWENKAPGRKLSDALKQLLDYSLALGSPPILVVSDRERIEIHTAFNGYPDEPRTILIEDIGQSENLEVLRCVFNDPERLRPGRSSAAITEEAAGKFADLATAMCTQGEDPHKVAHFLIQCLFCMFAEDEGLLPNKVFERLLSNAEGNGAVASTRLQKLFAAMKRGGDYGDNSISWFNGGLFKSIDIPSIEKSDLSTLEAAARDTDWRAIEPAIFGTLFERGLNPKKRSQLGAHYTDMGTIMRIVDHVVVYPLMEEWNSAKALLELALEKSKKVNDRPYREALGRFHGFLERLRNFRVLDPACGSGNFLYLALKALKDIEK
nr:type IIL restriction-modification enzyme MmeI [Caballeronia sp. ATUFL_M1_KS5A]